jgi:hypothetical protein
MAISLYHWKMIQERIQVKRILAYLATLSHWNFELFCGFRQSEAKALAPLRYRR